MTDEARYHFYLDMNRRREIPIQEPILEGNDQTQDNVESMNLEEWSITVTEFQPRENKKSKEQINKASQDEQEKKDSAVQCCIRSKSGYHTRRCPTKKGVDQSQQYCFNCGKEGLLADQCPLNQKNRKKAQSNLSIEACSSSNEASHYANKCTKTWMTMPLT